MTDVRGESSTSAPSPDDEPAGTAAPEAAAPAPSARGRTFEALQVREYRLLFASGLFVFLSVQAQQIVRGWLAAELTGSNRGLGGVFFGFAIPMMILTPFGGVAADRFPKRTVLLVSATLLVASALWIGLADAFGVLEYWMLIGAAAVQAAGFSIYGPSRISFTGELVGKETLANAIVLSQVSINSTRIVGPAAAGALIGVQAIGTAGTYLITAGLMVIALGLLVPLPHIVPKLDGPRQRSIEGFVEGIRYVRANRPVLLLIVTSYVVVMFAFPYLAFMPLVATELFDVGATGFGIMNAVSGCAAVVVSLRIAGLAHANLWRIQALAGTGFAIGVILFGLSPTFLLALGSLVVIGGCMSAFQAMNNTLIITESDPAFHGRVQSLLMLSFSGFGLAALPLGALADEIGLRPTMAGMGTVALTAMVVYQVVRSRMLRAGTALPA
ncbi:MAG: MFS transporter [Actinomycetota bacterium]|nr:MFS transporter [Actinomycetota bacterium]